jgi:hypothetical protein
MIPDKKHPIDYLEILTKEEIIDFLKKDDSWYRHGLIETNRIRHNIYFYKWNIVEKKLIEERKNHLLNTANAELTRKYNDTVKKFNAAEDKNFKMFLLDEMEKIGKQEDDFTKEYEKIRERQNANDKFYDEFVNPKENK